MLVEEHEPLHSQLYAKPSHAQLESDYYGGKLCSLVKVNARPEEGKQIQVLKQ